MPEIAKFFSLWFGLVSNFIAPMTPSMVKLVHPCKYSWKKKRFNQSFDRNELYIVRIQISREKYNV